MIALIAILSLGLTIWLVSPVTPQASDGTTTTTVPAYLAARSDALLPTAEIRNSTEHARWTRDPALRPALGPTRWGHSTSFLPACPGVTVYYRGRIRAGVASGARLPQHDEYHPSCRV